MSREQQINNVMECVYLVCAGDAEVSDPESLKIEEYYGVVRRIIKAQKAIEHFAETGDIVSSRKMFSPNTPIMHHMMVSLWGAPSPYLHDLITQRQEVKAVENLTKLERKTAKKLRSVFLRKVALIVCLEVAAVDGLSPGELHTLETMAMEWGLDIEETIEWYNSVAKPILTGEPTEGEQNNELGSLLDEFKESIATLPDDIDEEAKAELSEILQSLEKLKELQSPAENPGDENTIADTTLDSLPEIHQLAFLGPEEDFRAVWEDTEKNANDAFDRVPILFRAISGEEAGIAQLLIRSGSHVNVREPNGASPLALAVSRGNLPITELLLAAGADPEMGVLKVGTDLDGQPLEWEFRPLHLAVQANSPEVAKALIKAGAKVNERLSNGHTPLMTAAQNDALECAHLLLEEGAEVDTDLSSVSLKGWTPGTPLTVAALENSPSVAELLIERGANVSVSDGDGNTPLKMFAKHGQIDLVELIVARGADIEAADKEGWNPLISAAYRGRIDVVEALLSAGADPNARTTEGLGLTPLIAACELARDHVMESLLEIGVKPEEALPHGKIVKALIAAGADKTMENGDGKAAVQVARDTLDLEEDPKAQKVLKVIIKQLS